MTPDILTFFSNVPHYRPEVLDIAFTKLQFLTIDITNLNEMSSDHNLILVRISDSLISLCSLLPINWKKFSALLKKQIQLQNHDINTTQDIDDAIELFISNITSTLDNNSTINNHKNDNFKTPYEIVCEIIKKNRLY